MSCHRSFHFFCSFCNYASVNFQKAKFLAVLALLIFCCCVKENDASSATKTGLSAPYRGGRINVSAFLLQPYRHQRPRRLALVHQQLSLSDKHHRFILGGRVLQQKRVWCYNHHDRRELSLRLYSDNQNEDYNDDSTFDSNPPLLNVLLDWTLDIFSRPSPGLNDLAVGYPLVLLGTFFFAPAIQGFLTTFLFAFFVWLGRRVILDDDVSDEEYGTFNVGIPENDEDLDGPLEDASSAISSVVALNFFALGAAFATAGLLSPVQRETTDTEALSSNIILLPAAGAAIALIAVLTTTGLQRKGKVAYGSNNDSIRTSERRLLEQWDKRFLQQQKNGKRSG